MGHVVHPPKHPIVVERPRACDAVGASLRDAFARDASLPTEMSALLSTICGKDAIRPH